MVKKVNIEQWASRDGSVHKTRADATIHELDRIRVSPAVKIERALKWRTSIPIAATPEECKAHQDKLIREAYEAIDQSFNDLRYVRKLLLDFEAEGK